MLIVNPTLNDFVNLAADQYANYSLKEVGENWEFKLNKFSLIIPSGGDRFQSHAARAAMLVLAFYWSGMDKVGLQPDMLRSDAKEISESLNQWTEQVIEKLEQISAAVETSSRAESFHYPDEDILLE